MRRLLVTLSLFAAVVSCGGDATVTRPAAEIAGIYRLTSINGSPLPFVYAQSGADKSEVLDDAITLLENGEWSEVWHERYTESGVVTTEEFVDEGIYTRVGISITMSSVETGTVQGRLEGNTLTFTAPNVQLIYTR